MEKINKIKGALYGAIIGDALGAPLEFMPQEQIKAQFGKVGYKFNQAKELTKQIYFLLLLMEL